MKNYSKDLTLEKRVGSLSSLKSYYLFEDPFDLLYLTGLSLSKATLLVGEDIALFVDGRYKQAAKEKLQCEVLSTLDLKEWLKKRQGQSICFDASKTSYARFLQLQEMGKSYDITFTSSKNPLIEKRAIKDCDEIRKIEKSSEILMESFLSVLSLLQEGVKEEEIARAFQIEALKRGAQKVSFDPIIAFGENSAKPHYRSGQRSLKKGDLVLMDLGVMVDSYASDMTRSFAWGDIPSSLAHIKNLVKEIFEECLASLKPGVLVKDLDKKAKERMELEGYKPLHSLGHGVGLELHEFPTLSTLTDDVCLKEGMVITIEPGIYVEGLGGVRHEDMVLIEKNGYRNFYKRLYDVME